MENENKENQGKNESTIARIALRLISETEPEHTELSLKDTEAIGTILKASEVLEEKIKASKKS